MDFFAVFAYLHKNTQRVERVYESYAKPRLYPPRICITVLEKVMKSWRPISELESQFTTYSSCAILFHSGKLELKIEKFRR